MGDSVDFGPLRENGWKDEALPVDGTQFEELGAQFIRFTAAGLIEAAAAGAANLFGWARVGYSPGNLLVSDGVFTADGDYELPILEDPGSVIYKVPTDIPYDPATHKGRLCGIAVQGTARQVANLTAVGAGPLRILGGEPGKNLVRVVIQTIQTAP